MIKGAQKRSMDPIQQKLRQSKAVWNKDVSSFINDVIHLKKLMNGWPNKFHKERSKITEPIPADPATILGALAGDFQELAQRGNSLIQQQVQYSQNRRHSQPKAPEGATPATPAAPQAPATPAPATPGAPPAADLTKQLAASFAIKYDLVAEGSNPFSRFLARIKAPQAGFGQKAQVRRLRMDMLKAALKSYRALGRMQVQVSKSSKQSVMDAYKEMQAAWNEWSVVSRNFNLYANTQPGAVERPEQMKEEGYSPEKEEAELMSQQRDRSLEQSGDSVTQIVGDFQNYGPFFNTDKEAAKIMRAMNAIKVQNKGSTPPASLELLYKKLLAYLNQSLDVSGSSLKEIYEQSSAKPQPAPPTPKIPAAERLKGSQPPIPSELPEEQSATDQLEVTAQAFLKKWLGKTRHQMLPGRSSGVRLQIFELGVQARKNIDAVMNLLEKGLDVDAVGPKMYEVTKQMNMLRSLMRSLHNTEKPVKGEGGALEGFF